MNPLCFVLMPFGRKTDATGRVTDFDAVYREIIAPAAGKARLEALRADEEQVGGTIHKPMFERLMLCDYAIADVTGANPNVYYELGIRHALRPRATIILFAEGTTMPFDVALLRGIPYRVDENGKPSDAEGCVKVIAARLLQERGHVEDDSPLFQLIKDLPRIEVDHSKADIFRERAAYAQQYKDRLKAARLKGAEAVQAVAADPELSDLADVESGVVIDLFLSQRDVEDYAGMVDLYRRMPKPLQRTRMVQEQYGFALNRLQRTAEAEQVLVSVLKEFGASSETYGLLGRVYKDRWERETGPAGRALLRSAIDAYLAGFQADWRDAYPGINAVSLMEMLDKPDPRQGEVLPVVRYAALQKARREGDYWDYATLLELAVIANDKEAADEWLGEALARVPANAPWQLATTLRSLTRLRERRGRSGTWIKRLEDLLGKKERELTAARRPDDSAKRPQKRRR